MALPYVPAPRSHNFISPKTPPTPDIYFLQRNPVQSAAALALRDAVLRLRRDGAFVAVPLYRVNTDPIGPHPAGM